VVDQDDREPMATGDALQDRCLSVVSIIVRFLRAFAAPDAGEDINDDQPGVFTSGNST
jgi:hypothetical protein